MCTGRGVLIDYASWAEKKGIEYSTFSLHEVRLVDILEIARECNITFQRGDILLVRIGVTKEWETVMDLEAKKAYASSGTPKHAGVEGTLDVLKWVWNTGFAAVAGDAISWEVRIPTSPARAPQNMTGDPRTLADCQFRNAGIPASSGQDLDARVHVGWVGDAYRYAHVQRTCPFLSFPLDFFSKQRSPSLTLPRRDVRLGETRRDLQAAPEVDFFHLVHPAEHARRHLLAAQCTGHLLKYLPSASPELGRSINLQYEAPLQVQLQLPS